MTAPKDSRRSAGIYKLSFRALCKSKCFFRKWDTEKMDFSFLTNGFEPVEILIKCEKILFCEVLDGYSFFGLSIHLENPARRNEE